MKLKALLTALMLTAVISAPALAMDDNMSMEHKEAAMENMGKMEDMGKMGRMGGKKVDFASIKAKKLEGVKKHMATLQEKHDCIDATTDMDGLKSCKEKFKKKKEEMKKEWKAHREKMKEDRHDKKMYDSEDED